MSFIFTFIALHFLLTNIFGVSRAELDSCVVVSGIVTVVVCVHILTDHFILVFIATNCTSFFSLQKTSKLNLRMTFKYTPLNNQ